MCELRTIGAELTATPLVPTPPLSAVQARANGYVAARRRRSALAMSIVVGLTMTGVIKLGMAPTSDAVRMVGTPPGDPESPATTSTTVAPPGLPGLDAGASFLPWSGQTFDGDWGSIPKRGAKCPVGPANPKLPPVKILAHRPSTVLSPSPTEAVEAFYRRYNEMGGLCGRALQLVDRGFGAIPDDVVAVLGLPVDQVLDAAISDGSLARSGLPVVGGDGLSAVQHDAPFVYPVGTSAAALSRIAVKQAWERGARTFAVVHDATRPFGTESASAVNDYVRQLGGTVKVTIPLDAQEATSVTPSEAFGRACANQGCDFVFLALLPDLASDWLMKNPHVARIEMSGLPTLLTSAFADACFKSSNQRCDGITAWSGFIPPFGVHADNLEALYAWDPLGEGRGSAMVEAAIVGARVLLEALEATGPGLSRDSLRRTLDAFTFTSYVSAPLRWPQGAPRVGNPVSQAWRLTLDGVARTEDARKAAAQAADNGRAVAEDRPYDWRNPDYPTVELPKREWHEAGTGWRSDPQ